MSDHGLDDNVWANLFDEGDEEDRVGSEGEQFHPWMNKDSIIFLIDAHSHMFQQTNDDEVPFENALRCAISTLTDKIISSDSDLVGVCLFGTREKNNPNDFENIFVFQDLEMPDAQKIIDLENLLKSDFSVQFGHFPEDTKHEFPFCDALWTCSTMFSSCTTKVGHKRIFLFTNHDNPNPLNNHIRSQNIQRAKDLAQLGIDIELFSMNKPGEIFDPTKFYQEIIAIDAQDDTGVWNYNATAKFQELQQRVRRKEFKKRSLGSLSLIIPGQKSGNTLDIEIGVALYNILHDTKRSAGIPLDAKTNKPLKRVRKYVCQDTGTLLMEHQILFAFDYGGERVIFEKPQLDKVKFSQFKPGLTLLGFKPRDKALKNQYNLKHASFIYPQESSISGSTAAFIALYHRMLASDKVAIVCVTPRSNSTPKIAALLPQLEGFDEDGNQNSPPGFSLIWLPFAGDMRSTNLLHNDEAYANPTTGTLTKIATTEQIVLAKKLVKTLRIKFDSQNFENPALQKHYANLQALALDRETEEEVEDYVLPDEEGMAKFSPIIQEFKEAIFPTDYEPNTKPKKTPASTPKTPKKKRPRPDFSDQEYETNNNNNNDNDDESGNQSDAPAIKRRKLNNNGDKESIYSNVNWQQVAANGTLAKLNIPQLKAYCSKNKIKNFSKLKKHELVELVQSHLSDQL